ncbi:group 1 glycosyl transferase [Thermococcus litoralis DSM 5473]|uniref:Group 1 glycosyl transferase n=1 Tax=Thermococcus litoralis (strain ATCC 51850 / DSM 5473 / JCM 8560 / NS-C) TaxID=523849 RepID=H3ZLL1_THELN|nr:glycosyltransferase [Thermococcus litoralis]EHR79149.1 group 1 glycosyl transferase [Thermococcus litoralis DSM 5473]KUJ99937.1 MAG: Uncharacterized protein XD43_0402 [Thermococcales archaeon 44_46]HIH72979.1 glycosyltransferase family 4 protein [Thermococcaceae archaeon]
MRSIGVVYGLPEKYATSIRLKKLLGDIKDKNIRTRQIIPIEWEGSIVKKISIILRNIMTVLDPRFEVDILYVSAPLIASSIPGIIAKLLKKTPLVVDWDDAFVDFRKNKPRSWEISFWEYLAIKLADKVVVVSPELKKIALHLGKNRGNVIYVPNGVDMQISEQKYDEEREKMRKKLGIRDDEIVVGFVGRISRRKNTFVGKELVDCAEQLKTSNMLEYFRFLIIGFGEGFETLKRYAEEKGVSNKFIFTGYVEHSEIPFYISAMDICVVPVGKKFTDTVRSSFKLKEFIAMGKPVITVNYGSFSYETRNGKFAVLIDDNSELPNALLTLDAKTLRKKAVSGRKFVRTYYSWEYLKDKLVEFLNT